MIDENSLEHRVLLNNDENYRNLFFLKKNLESLLSQWTTMPVRQTEPHYKKLLDGADFIIGNFILKKRP